MSAGKRTVISISLSPSSPDAVAVAEALSLLGVGPGRRSATILAWAAAYLAGRTAEASQSAASALSDDELDALLDDF